MIKMKNQAMQELSREYEELAHHWSDLSRMFLATPKTNDRGVFGKSQPKILEITTLEEKALLSLNQIYEETIV